jgi:hypothetical protein
MFKRTEENVLAFVLLFAVIGTAAHMVNVSTVWGPAGQHFTLFDFFSALPTAFLGLWSGLAAVLIAKLAAVLVLGMPLDGATMLRLLPPLAAGAFFYAYKQGEQKAGQAQKDGTKTKLVQFFQFGFPILAIALFVLHPAIFGTLGMVFALYWTIPIIAALLPSNLYLRSLGATFSQHAAGGVLWLYFVPGFANPAVWLALIPVVVVERAVFAGGIAVSYRVVDVAIGRVSAFLRTPDGRPATAPQAARKKR